MNAVPDAAEKYHAEYPEDFVDLWDRLVGWDARARSEGTFFIDLLRDSGARRVLDAATGTGFHAIALAEAGFDVMAVDGAPTMTAKARENLAERGLDVPCRTADWRRLDQVVAGPFDAIVCLGNSFGHLFDPADLAATLAQFRDALAPGGLLVIDQRNYDAVLDGTLKNHRSAYCCCGGGASVDLRLVDADLVRITYTVGGDRSNTIETHPWRCRAMVEAIAAAGFVDVVTRGDYRLDYDPATAEFLVHTARKPGP